MLTTDEKNKIINDCKNLNTVKEAFDYIAKNFVIEDCKMSVITKLLFIEGLIKSINLLNPKKRV